MVVLNVCLNDDDDVVGGCICICDDQVDVDKDSIDKQWNSRNDSILIYRYRLSLLVKDEHTRTVVGTKPTSVCCRRVEWKEMGGSVRGLWGS